MENMDQNQHKHQKPQYRNEADISASSWYLLSNASRHERCFLSTDFYFAFIFTMTFVYCMKRLNVLRLLCIVYFYEPEFFKADMITTFYL